ncbi:dirigent protein 10-like [Pecten maximus]|uniref:dirigent protein 10-like n=1 Tax=Pecten maximus TaxID=6579 RepID=UPI001458BF49|nr:dirigent protein 10-like [Pecten maximus]
MAAYRLLAAIGEDDDRSYANIIEGSYAVGGGEIAVGGGGSVAVGGGGSVAVGGGGSVAVDGGCSVAVGGGGSAAFGGGGSVGGGGVAVGGGVTLGNGASLTDIDDAAPIGGGATDAAVGIALLGGGDIAVVDRAAVVDNITSVQEDISITPSKGVPAIVNLPLFPDLPEGSCLNVNISISAVSWNTKIEDIVLPKQMKTANKKDTIKTKFHRPSITKSRLLTSADIVEQKRQKDIEKEKKKQEAAENYFRNS